MTAHTQKAAMVELNVTEIDDVSGGGCWWPCCWFRLVPC